ncbi:methyltransferase domain-containing protein [Sphingobacterium pedocola]|uniref:Ubiquinone biosynthesis protein UbiE n=1 Tax=Sphingobacterium pedocola TaxID=2082722 RepID=A0ABR9T753_9SPHI|nr:methyltransferase domain-containing protein [Sphingobacterium pedocola]MBE8720904.1 ubiquinone biosynthesis protein UbiE [Sphingobacterium pedocola]
MTDAKHYGAGYLTDTGDFLKQLKVHSYAPFSNTKEGVVVDLGCGTGMDAILIADMLGDVVRVVGIDHDPLMIEQARIATGARTNINFISGEVYKLDFEDNGIAGVRMERVVQHLSQPATMFQEVYRVLRPGHPVVIVETIWNSLNLYSGHVELEQRLRDYLTDQKVNNGWAGNKLTKDLASNGFQEIRLETYCMVVRSKEEANRYLFLNRIIAEMVEKEILSDEEAADFTSSLERADEGGYFTCSMNLVLAKAIK